MYRIQTIGTPRESHVRGIMRIGSEWLALYIGDMFDTMMGQAWVRTGPPETITFGSSGLMMAGKSATSKGGRCEHRGSFVTGCSTVLIGDDIPDDIGNLSALLNSIPLYLKGFERSDERFGLLRSLLTSFGCRSRWPYCKALRNNSQLIR